MDNLLLNLETEFYFITGVYLEGVGGLLFGLIFFSLAISLIRFGRKQEQIIANIDRRISPNVFQAFVVCPILGL